MSEGDNLQKIPEIKLLTCLKCGWEWYPRYPQKPAVCPKCKSHAWDETPKKQSGKTIDVCMRADSKLRQALRDARQRGVTYNGKLVSDDLAFEIGVRHLLNKWE